MPIKPSPKPESPKTESPAKEDFTKAPRVEEFPPPQPRHNGDSARSKPGKLPLANSLPSRIERE